MKEVFVFDNALGLYEANGLISASQILTKANEVVRSRSKPSVETRFDSTAASKAFISDRLQFYEHEVFCCLLLTSKNKYLGFVELFRGTVNKTCVFPRELVKLALNYNAAAVILAHNHPSGDPTPSQADIKLTQRLSAALGLIEVRVLDHIVVGGQQGYSFADNGLI